MIELDELKSYLGLQLRDEDDDLLETIEKSAVSYLEERSNRYLGAPKSETVTLSGRGRRSVYLGNMPISVSTIEYRATFGTGWDEQDLADFQFDGRTITSIASIFPIGTRNVRVRYRHGFNSGAEPEFVRQAVRELVEQWYRERVTVVGGTVPGPESTQIFTPRTVEYAVRELLLLPGV